MICAVTQRRTTAESLADATTFVVDDDEPAGDVLDALADVLRSIPLETPEDTTATT